ncbi:hypothetical protein KUO17_24705 [Pseudomonas sp. MAFF 301350]|uniref:protein acetyllysine N-acetyltransferase n=1 Tax=Pseudomonas aegrilactucae TaxID=2854028 RepID=A0A9Q2XNX8_9PSED|nr:hypothetical protein [Pseudomonas aegrilactucae]
MISVSSAMPSLAQPSLAASMTRNSSVVSIPITASHHPEKSSQQLSNTKPANHVPRLTLVTQNVDDLHERAGSRNVNHLHGSLHSPRCIDCGALHGAPAWRRRRIATCSLRSARRALCIQRHKRHLSVLKRIDGSSLSADNRDPTDVRKDSL